MGRLMVVMATNDSSGISIRLRGLRLLRTGIFLLLGGGWLQADGLGPGGAARYLIDVWSADQGLPNSSVTALAQSPDGYLWIGTRQGGLVRFDGANFTRPTFTADPPMPGRDVTMLEVDSAGTMWAMQEGPHQLISYGNGVFTSRIGPSAVLPALFGGVVARFGDEVILSGNEGVLVRLGTRADSPGLEVMKPPFKTALKAGIKDPRGRIWLRSTTGVLGYLEGGRFDLYIPGADGVGSSVNALASGPDGRVWIGSNNGLAVLEKGIFRLVVPEGLPMVPPVLQIAFSGDGGMWVRTETRILKELNGRWVVNVEPWGGQPGLFYMGFELHGDVEGGAWLPEAGRGVWHVDGHGALESIGLREGLPGSLVTAWLQDREGGIWMGTPGGLARLRPRLFGVVGAAQGLQQPVVRSIAQDAAGKIWLSSAGGLASWGNERCEQVALPAPTDGTPLTDVMIAGDPTDNTGALWVGTVGGGAFRWKNGAAQNPFPPRDVGVAIRAVLPDRKGGVWFGGEFGLYRWDGSQMRNFGNDEGTPPGQFFDIKESANGDIWTTSGGTILARYRDNRFELWQPKELSELPAYAVLPDNDETVWVGTLGGGLLRWHRGEFFRFTSNHGLPSDSVFQLLDDGLGYIWGGTRQGVFRVKKRALNEVADRLARHATFNLYGRGDGLPSLECSAGAQPSALRAQDGKLWFSTVRGALVVDPKLVQSSTLPPPVRIEEVRVDGVALVGHSVENGGGIRLPPGSHTLEFRFAGLSLSAPEKVRFRWRVSGVDAGWVEGGFQRIVSYGSFLPGDYRMEVRACNQDGGWNKEGASFGFSIEPQIWERGLFQIGSGVMLLVIAASLVAWIQRRRYLRKLDLLDARRALEMERARIARDLHDDLGAGLAQINISSGLVAMEGIDPSFVGPLLQGIGTRSRELITALDEIVWAINPKNDTLKSLATYLCQYAQNFLGSAQIACRLEVDPDLPDLPLNSEQRHGLFLAFAEAVHNAVSHSEASEVGVVINFGGGKLQLTVADNGRGLPVGSLAPGADGLANMQERLTQLGGICRIISQPEGGMKVVFNLPLCSI